MLSAAIFSTDVFKYQQTSTFDANTVPRIFERSRFKGRCLREAECAEDLETCIVIGLSVKSKVQARLYQFIAPEARHFTPVFQETTFPVDPFIE